MSNQQTGSRKNLQARGVPDHDGVDGQQVIQSTVAYESCENKLVIFPQFGVRIVRDVMAVVRTIRNAPGGYEWHKKKRAVADNGPEMVLMCPYNFAIRHYTLQAKDWCYTHFCVAYAAFGDGSPVRFRLRDRTILRVQLKFSMVANDKAKNGNRAESSKAREAKVGLESSKDRTDSP
jgi:hypothetical protein